MFGIVEKFIGLPRFRQLVLLIFLSVITKISVISVVRIGERKAVQKREKNV